MELRWLVRLAFQRGVTASAGASTSNKAKRDFMIYSATWRTGFIMQEVLSFMCIIAVKKDIQATSFQTFHQHAVAMFFTYT